MVLVPALESVLSSAISSALSAPSGRYFTQFDDVQKSYITTPIISMSNDEISLALDLQVVNALANSGIAVLYTDTLGEHIGLQLEATGALKIFTDGFTPPSGSIPVNDGKLHRVNMVINKSSGVCELYVDGALDYSVTHSNPSILRDAYYLAMGAKIIVSGGGVSGNMSGIIANATIDNGNLIFNMPIDGNYSPTNNTVIDTVGGNNGTFIAIAEGDSKPFHVRPDGNYEGENQMTQFSWENPFLADTSWVYDTLDNTWSLTSSGDIQKLKLFPLAGIDTPFLIRGQCSSLSGEIRLTAEAANPEYNISTTGLYEGVVLFGQNQQYRFALGFDGSTCTLEKPEFREYLEVAYPLPSARGAYTLSSLADDTLLEDETVLEG